MRNILWASFLAAGLGLAVAAPRTGPASIAVVVTIPVPDRAGKAIVAGRAALMAYLLKRQGENARRTAIAVDSGRGGVSGGGGGGGGPRWVTQYPI